MLIRKLRSGEESAVSRVYALSWKAGYRGIVPPEYLDALPLDHWVPLLTGDTLCSLVLEENSQITATACVAPARDERMAGWGELVSCYVLPEHWDKGVGSALLGEAVAELLRGGFPRIYLWVLEENTRARAFYEKNGFSPTGEAETLIIGGRELTEIRYAFPADPDGEGNGR